jgi:hypothetical protein
MHLYNTLLYPISTTNLLVLLLFTLRDAATEYVTALVQIEAKEEGHADAFISTPVLRAVYRTHIPF